MTHSLCPELQMRVIMGVPPQVHAAAPVLVSPLPRLGRPTSESSCWEIQKVSSLVLRGGTTLVYGAGRAWKRSGSEMLPALGRGAERGPGSQEDRARSSCSGCRAGSYQHQLCRGSDHTHFISHSSSLPSIRALLLRPLIARASALPEAGGGDGCTDRSRVRSPPPSFFLSPCFLLLHLPLSLSRMPRALSCVLLSRPPTQGLRLRCTQHEGDIGPALPFMRSPRATRGQPCGDPYCPWQYVVGRCTSFKVPSGQPVCAVVFINSRVCAGCGISIPKDANTVVH